MNWYHGQHHHCEGFKSSFGSALVIVHLWSDADLQILDDLWRLGPITYLIIQRYIKECIYCVIIVFHGIDCTMRHALAINFLWWIAYGGLLGPTFSWAASIIRIHRQDNKWSNTLLWTLLSSVWRCFGHLFVPDHISRCDGTSIAVFVEQNLHIKAYRGFTSPFQSTEGYVTALFNASKCMAPQVLDSHGHFHLCFPWWKATRDPVITQSFFWPMTAGSWNQVPRNT